MAYLKDRCNRGLIVRVLELAGESGDARHVPLLEAWEAVDYRKVREAVRRVIGLVRGRAAEPRRRHPIPLLNPRLESPTEARLPGTRRRARVPAAGTNAPPDRRSTPDDPLPAAEDGTDRRRLRWFRALLAGCFLCSLALSPLLWLTRRDYPLVPLLDGLPQPPRPWTRRCSRRWGWRSRARPWRRRLAEPCRRCWRSARSGRCSTRRAGSRTSPSTWWRRSACCWRKGRAPRPPRGARGPWLRSSSSSAARTSIPGSTSSTTTTSPSTSRCSRARCSGGSRCGPQASPPRWSPGSRCSRPRWSSRSACCSSPRGRGAPRWWG